MIDDLLNSWTMGALAYLGVFVVGRKRRWGWLVLVATQLGWAVYGLVHRDYGFTVGGLGFGALNLSNYVRWRRADREVARLLASVPPSITPVGVR